MRSLPIFFLLSIPLCHSSKQGRFELAECDEIIPKFVDHISNAEDPVNDCDQVGQFPKPGDCTVFFKCVRGRGRILPILEYCALGYNFDGTSCIRSDDDTDCPQFNCIPSLNATSSPVSRAEGQKSNLEKAVPAAQHSDNAAANITLERLIFVINLCIFFMTCGQSI